MLLLNNFTQDNIFHYPFRSAGNCEVYGSRGVAAEYPPQYHRTLVSVSRPCRASPEAPVALSRASTFGFIRRMGQQRLFISERQHRHF